VLPSAFADRLDKNLFKVRACTDYPVCSLLKKGDDSSMDWAMKPIFSIAPMVFIFFLAISCSNSDPSGESRSSEPAAGSRPDQNLRILFRWPGDDLATKQQLETRDRIERLISERQIGKVIQSGTGMGWMDIIVEVAEKDRARERIEKIIRQISPDSKFTIQ
jgi:hypothetical protein